MTAPRHDRALLRALYQLTGIRYGKYSSKLALTALRRDHLRRLRLLRGAA